MRHRLATLVCAMLTLGWLSVVCAAPGDELKSHEGVVVSAAEGKLVMTDKDGTNEHDHAVPGAAQITLNGKSAKLSDLQKGDKVVVSQNSEDAVVKIAATR